MLPFLHNINILNFQIKKDYNARNFEIYVLLVLNIVYCNIRENTRMRIALLKNASDKIIFINFSPNDDTKEVFSIF